MKVYYYGIRPAHGASPRWHETEPPMSMRTLRLRVERGEFLPGGPDAPPEKQVEGDIAHVSSLRDDRGNPWTVLCGWTRKVSPAFGTFEAFLIVGDLDHDAAMAAAKKAFPRLPTWEEGLFGWWTGRSRRVMVGGEFWRIAALARDERGQLTRLDLVHPDLGEVSLKA